MLTCNYGVSFHLSKNSAQPVGPYNWNTLHCICSCS